MKERRKAGILVMVIKRHHHASAAFFCVLHMLTKSERLIIHIKKIIIGRHYERGPLAKADFLTNVFFFPFSPLQKVTGAKVRKISE